MQTTKAVDHGDHYVLTGNKIFITNAGYADIYIIFAMTDATKGIKGISAFIVEKDFEGFTVGPKEKKLGIRGSSTCELILRDVKVPKDNLLGEVGMGFKIAMQTLDGGRIGIAAQALGIAEGAFERALIYIKKRKQFNKRIADFQNTQFAIAEMKTKLEAGKLLLYQAASDKDQGISYSMSAAMAKLYNSRIAVEVTDQCIQLLGGYGYIRDYEIERYYRDAKITEIYEGTSEVQKMVIASKVINA
jgi:butyryl-CoA dehydrogenase